MDSESLASSIIAGAVGVLPTDTLYGLVGSAFFPATVSRIYELKKRDPSKPFIVLVSDLSDLSKFGVVVDDKIIEVLNKIWPGPFSVILPCGKEFDFIHRGGGKIAFRFPAKEDLRRLISRTGPLVAPSANTEGNEPAKNISEAKRYFGKEADFYIDGGELPGEPSTLVEYRDGELILIRQGAGQLK